MTTRLTEKLTEMPDIPKEFGDDGGNFYKYYDELAEELDEDLVKSLKAQLDGILIFAGLFAGVNSAFLALTLPQMSADLAEDTNALLLQIALGGNSSIKSTADLPSASFTPPAGIYSINVLFSVSLALALFSSFLAVLGQQWIVFYRKRGGGGPEHQRWEQLQRYLGAKRWRLELVLDDLVPSLLQLGLVIFSIAFALYLNTLSHSLNRIIGSLVCFAGIITLALSTCVAFDPWCPFKLPWSRVVRPATCAIAAGVTWLGACSVATVVFVGRFFITAARRTMIFFHPTDADTMELWRGIWRDERKEFVETYTTGPAKTYEEFLSAAIRSPETPDDLKIIALRRVMCTSEDHKALMSSALNLQVVSDQKALSSLAKDDEFRNRLSGLYEGALEDTQQGRTSKRDPFIQARVFSAAFSHLLIITGSVRELTWTAYKMKPSQIMDLGNLHIFPTQIRDLNRGSSIHSFGRCDRCSHCTSLAFCMRVVNLIVEGFNDSLPTNLDLAYEGVVGAWTKGEDLRLGYIVASVILSSKEWCDADPQHYAEWPRSNLLNKLFDAYRAKPDSGMFGTISSALNTVNDEWRRKPSHEIYVMLFKLCLLPRRKRVSIAAYNAVVESVDDHLISIERLVRDQNASEIDCQRGRDLQNQYIQSVVDFFGADQDSSRNMWVVIGPSLGHYLESVTEIVEEHPGHPEDLRTIEVLHRIQSSFPEPQPVRAPAETPGLGSYQDSERTAYLKFRQLLSQLYSRLRSTTLSMKASAVGSNDKRKESGQYWWGN
ncbi:hypothetical protein FRC00_005339 [Tulasnella sp. 408]|nr:hypothetical protein FRC00_005339 [Tulasnella sp. 408]